MAGIQIIQTSVSIINTSLCVHVIVDINVFFVLYSFDYISSIIGNELTSFKYGSSGVVNRLRM